MGAGMGGGGGGGKKIDKKKALPVTKKFPELKLMINGEHRNNSNSLSSDEENLNVSAATLVLFQDGNVLTFNLTSL